METTLELEDKSYLKIVKAFWQIERVAWFVLLGIMVAAVLGYVGPGVLKEKIDVGQFNIEFDKMTHIETPSPILITGVLKSNKVHIAISHKFLRGTSVKSVRPDPKNVRTEGDSTVFEFEGTSGSTLNALFELNRSSPGKVSGDISIDGSNASLTQIAWP